MKSITLAILLAMAQWSNAWEFTDHRGKPVNTFGQRTIIIIGQLDCATMPRQVSELAAVKAAHRGLEVIALLPCDAPQPERVTEFVNTVPGAKQITVCETPISHPIFDLWAAQGYRQPFGTYWDAGGFHGSAWTNYQDRSKFTVKMTIGRDRVPRRTESLLPWQSRATITNGCGIFSLALP